MDSQEFLDEVILKQRQERLKEQHLTLETGIYMNGEIKEFERREVIEGTFVKVPKDFALMPDELADAKYPFIYRPACILTSADLNVNLNFNQFKNNLQASTMIEVTEAVQQTLEKEQDVFSLGEIRPLNKIEGCYFDFQQKVMDGELYHMLANIKMQGHIYQFTFNCLLAEGEEWQPVVLQMWESTEYEDKER